MEKFNLLKKLLGLQAKAQMFTPAEISKRKKIVAVAPDKFKGTLSAQEVAETITEALLSLDNVDVRTYPMADGGEGTAALLAGEMRLQRAVTAGMDARMRPTEIEYLTDGETVAIDSAAVIGLTKVSDLPLNSWATSSYPLGKFVDERIQQGARHIYVGVGGTATTEGGAGFLQALGATFYDAWGVPVAMDSPITTADLSRVYGVNLKGVDKKRLREIIVGLADVDVPLVPAGEGISQAGLSSLNFASQKGIDDNRLPHLARILKSWREAVDEEMLPAAVEPRFQGAGGGLGFALSRVIKAPVHSGAKYITARYGIFETLPAPDMVITGEGRFDRQSDQGKVVGTILRYARHQGIPALVVCGSADRNYPDMIQTSALMGRMQKLSHDSALEALGKSLPYIVNSVKRELTN